MRRRGLVLLLAFGAGGCLDWSGYTGGGDGSGAPRDMGSTALDGAPDMAANLSGLTLRGATSGLGGGRSVGGAFVLSGSIGIPQPRVVSTGGKFTLVPIVPGQ